MAGTQQFDIVLPDNLARMLKAKVSSGEYKDISEVVCAGLSILKERSDALEIWLNTEAATTYDKLKVDPGRALSLDQVRHHLLSRRYPERSMIS